MPDREKESLFDRHISFLQFQNRLFTKQKAKNPDTGKSLRKDRCKCSASYSHMEPKNKYRIQDNICHCSKKYGKHSRFCKSLSSDKQIHSQCDLYKNSSKSIDIHICHCIINGIFTCAKSKEEIPVPDQEEPS